MEYLETEGKRVLEGIQKLSSNKNATQEERDISAAAKELADALENNATTIKKLAEQTENISNQILVLERNLTGLQTDNDLE